MHNVDRDSAVKLLKVLRTDNEKQMINGHGALEMLARVMGRKVEGDKYKGPPLSTGKSNLEKLERFFDQVIQVELAPALPYTAKDVASFALQCQLDALESMANCATGNEEDQEMVSFYSGIAVDFKAIAQVAETGNLRGAIALYYKLDTADRDKFGWGSEGWEERRWYATLDLYPRK